MPDLFKNLEPVRVSPLIRGTRWIFLIAGIFFGASKRKFLAQREVGIREREEEERKIRQAQIKEQKRIESEKEMELLAEIFLGTPPTPKTDKKKLPLYEFDAEDHAEDVREHLKEM